MKKQVVRAGAYFSVGIVLIACLPVFLPLLFLLSIFGFVFVLPLGCALAGFLCLRKYVGMLYRKLPSTLGGCSPWGRQRPLPRPCPDPPLFEELYLTDQQAIETFESVDPEFDFVVISTAPPEEERRCFGGEDGAGIESDAEAGSSVDASADDGTVREGVDADEFVKYRSLVGEKGLDTIADNGTNREGTDNDYIAEKGIRTEGITAWEKDAETTTENGTNWEGTDDDEVSEKGTTREDITVGEYDETTIADKGTSREGTDDEIAEKATGRERITVEENDDETITDKDASREGTDDDEIAEKCSQKKGIEVEANDGATNSDNWTSRNGTDDDEIAEKDIRKKGSNSDAFTDSKTRPAGAGDDTYTGYWTMEKIDVPTFAEDWTERGEANDDTYPGKMPETEVGGDVSGDDGTKKDRIGADTADDDVNKSAQIDGDSPLDDKREPEPELDLSAKFGTRTEWKDSTPVEDWTRKEGGYSDRDLQEEEEAEHENEIENPNEEKMENTMLGAVNNEDSFDSQEKLGRTAIIKQIEERSKQGEVHVQPDGGAYPEVGEEEEGSEGIKTQSKDAKEQNLEAGPVLGELGDDQHRKSLPSAIVAITQSSVPEAGEKESPTKLHGHFLPHQANEDDIWICKDCGWKYPNAKPSAKIRRNHKKHCMGSSARAPVPDSRIRPDVCSPTHEDQSQVVNLVRSSTISSADSDGHNEQTEVANTGTSESFRSAQDELPQDVWSSFDSVESRDDKEEGQLAQLQQEVQLSDDLNAVKGVVGDKHVSTGPLVTDIEELSEFLGIELPVRSGDLPEIEWAKLAIEVMKVVVGID